MFGQAHRSTVQKSHPTHVAVRGWPFVLGGAEPFDWSAVQRQPVPTGQLGRDQGQRGAGAAQGGVHGRGGGGQGQGEAQQQQQNNGASVNR